MRLVEILTQKVMVSYKSHVNILSH